MVAHPTFIFVFLLLALLPTGALGQDQAQEFPQVFSDRPDWSLYASLTLNEDHSFIYKNRMNLRTSGFECRGQWTQQKNKLKLQVEGECTDIPEHWILHADRICTQKKNSLMYDPLRGRIKTNKRSCLNRESGNSTKSKP